MPDASLLFRWSPGPLAEAWPYRALAAGRTVFRPQDGRVSQAYHQHVLILTLSGMGAIDHGGAAHLAREGTLAWLDTSRRYSHGALGPEPWVYLWAGVQGTGLDLLHRGLGLMDDPVIEVGEKGTDLANSFEEILEALKAGDGLAGGAVNAALARIFASLSGLRIPNTTLAETLGAEDRTAGLMRRIRRNLSQEWPVARMAEAAGMSEAQLFRRFGQVTGTSPQAWLRRERIELAAHLLAATPDKIAAIALRCGYSDPFHFSRDFKRLQGEAPRSFRMSRRRSLAAPAEAYWH